MRLLICHVVLAIALVGCASEVASQTTLLETTPPETATAEPVPATPALPTAASPPQWEGFESTRGADPLLAAYAANGPVDVYGAPGDAEPTMTIDGTTILGTVTVLGVVGGPESGWVEVMLPVRPNGSTGWVAVEDVSLYVVDGEIKIDLSERRLTYVVEGAEVLTTDVGIGSDHNETPIGEFFVTDNVTLADPNSPWGPHALGISARSETITEFNGGDGIIGIHGTNNPGSIGGSISLGCVRLPNDIITALHEMVPLGTRVTVQA
jgi:lipoprotein-anchoring transpeptidase ErfK/SrfK